MAWLRIDDGFAHHPKVVALSPRDRWTWLELLCYCARYRTRGVVPASIAKVIHGASPSFIGRAFELGLIEENTDGEGWRVHDWAVYNGESLSEKVAAFLSSRPEASANEVAKEVGGKREVVLAEVAKQRGFAGSREPGGGTDPGTEVSPKAVPFARARAAPSPSPRATSEGDGGSETTPPAAQQAAPAGAELGQLPVAANCPVCGPLHSVPRGFDMVDHVSNVHGYDRAEALELVAAS